MASDKDRAAFWESLKAYDLAGRFRLHPICDLCLGMFWIWRGGTVAACPRCVPTAVATRNTRNWTFSWTKEESTTDDE